MKALKTKIQDLLLDINEYYLRVDWSRIKIIFISTFCWGIIAHGYMMFNKFSWGDDVTNMFFFGTTYELGRWMLEFLRRLFIFFFEANCSQPFVNGMGSFLCIAIVACLLSDLFHIKKKSSLIMLTGAMVTTPTVLGIFLFMFTSFAYMIGLLLCVTGVWIVCKTKSNPISFLIGSFLICCAIGVYQAWLPMALSVFLVYFLVELLNDHITDWKSYLLKALYYVGVCGVALGLYLAINEYILITKNITMLNHAGVDSYGIVSFSEYLQRIKWAYRMFFRPERSFYPSFISKVYKLLLLLEVFMSLYCMVKSFKQRIGKGLQVLLLLILFPLTVCFIYVIAGDAYALVLYPYTMVYLYFIWLLDNSWNKQSIWTVWGQRAGIVLVGGMCLWLCRYSNVTYMKAELLQARAISYYTTLITRMQSVEGYSEDLPIAYVNAHQNNSLETVTITTDFEGIALVPDTFLHDYSWNSFMEEWCGFSQQKVDSAKLSEIENSKEVISMPAYPNDGSIQVIDGTLVVKLAEE